MEQVLAKLNAMDHLYFNGKGRSADRIQLKIDAFKTIKKFKEKIDENEKVFEKCNKELLLLTTQMTSWKLHQAQEAEGSADNSLEIAQKEFVDAWKIAGEMFFVSSKDQYGGHEKRVIEGRKNSIEVAIHIRQEKFASLLARSNALEDNNEERAALLERAIEEADAIVEHCGHLVASDSESAAFKPWERYFECLAINVEVDAFHIKEMHGAQKVADTDMRESWELLAERSAAVRETATRLGVYDESLELTENFLEEQSSETRRGAHELLAAYYEDISLRYRELAKDSADPTVDKILQEIINSVESLKDRMDKMAMRLDREGIASPKWVKETLKKYRFSGIDLETFPKHFEAPLSDDHQSIEASESENSTTEALLEDVAALAVEDAYDEVAEEQTEAATVKRFNKATARINGWKNDIKEELNQLEKEQQKYARLQNNPNRRNLPLIEYYSKKITTHEETLGDLNNKLAALYKNLADEEKDTEKAADYQEKERNYLDEKELHLNNATAGKEATKEWQLKYRNLRLCETPTQLLLEEVKDSEIEDIRTIKLPHALEAKNCDGDYLLDSSGQPIYDHVVEHQ
ncbi:MAG TPA: hypothetical protein VM532_10145, partial [Burkholderiales bacterium]|nr:hypothetical protein [Burkholderiales bacterium]